MKIIVSTCDKYMPVVEALKYSIESKCKENLDVTVLGFKEPKFDLGNWKFISLGVDTGPESFSNDIWKFFENFEDEFFFWLNDDAVSIDNIDLDLL